MLDNFRYYKDSEDRDTPWLKRHESIHPAGHSSRGNFTYYVHLTSSLWKLDHVKVSALPGTEPTNEQEWDTYVSGLDPIKSFEYYAADCDDGKAGMLKKEIVPDIHGTTDNITEYKYGYGTTGTPYEWKDSPTQTLYQYWNGTGYDAETSYASYDDTGRVTCTTDASGEDETDGRKIWYEYDDLGRQTKTIYAKDGGTPTIYTENNYSCCTLDWSMDEEGNKTYYAYDGINRVTKVWTDVSGQTESTPLVQYTYDAFGNKETVTTRSDSSATRTTSYTYDKNNRVTKIVYPYEEDEEDLIGNEEFGYDDVGNLWWKKDGNGAVTLNCYDGLHRLFHVHYDYQGSLTPPSCPGEPDPGNPSSDGVIYTYYGGSNLRETMVDSSGTSSYEYDIQGRLTKYTPSVGLDTGYYVEYDYNNLGQKIYEKITDGTTTDYDCRYEYYANGWLWKVKNGTSDLATYSYDAVGNRIDLDLANGTHTDYDYDTDPRYRLNTITHKYGENVLAEIDYTDVARDKVGNPKSMTDWTGPWAYDYDENNRLISVVPPNPIPSQPAGGDYGYDWVGNRLNPPANPNPMQYNAVDQLTSWPGMHSYTYYSDGSLHEVKTGQTTVAAYTYHPTGLLNEAVYLTPSGSHTATNTWDANANRVQLEMNDSTYTFVYDITAGIPAVVEENKVGDNPVYYYREPNGALIARQQGSTWHYYHFDALGSTRLLTDSDGDVTDAYAYDAYGSLIAHDQFTGSIDQPYQYVGQLGYYTHWESPDFALLQLGVRFYDPQTGRFTERDAIRNFRLAAYCYSSNRPTRSVDPMGLQDTGGGLTVPTLVKHESCDDIGYGQLIDDSIKWAQNYVAGIVDKLELTKCSDKITVRCWRSNWFNRCLRLGGWAIPLVPTVHIILPFKDKDGNAVPPACQILHEMIHSCGKWGHKWQGEIDIPGCPKWIL